MERKTEEFEDKRKKWKIYFDIESNNLRNDAVVTVRFRANRKESPYLTKSDFEKLKEDLKDLGKFRIIKQGRGFLGNK